MILANKLVAEKLAEKLAEKSNEDSQNYGLFRSQQSPDIIKINKSDNTDTYDKTPQHLIKKYELCNLERARYQIGVRNCRHSRLNLEYYTHFTSPMRRYADILVHRQLEKILNKQIITKTSEQMLFLINFYSNFYKQVSRYSNLIYVVDKLSEISEFYAYVVTIKEGTRLRLYIPDLDLDYEYQIINNKFKHLIQHKCDESILELQNIVTGSIVYIQLFLFIKIRIAKLERSMEKISVIIIDPDILFILGIN
jgi:hypothetical protein